MIRSTSTLDSLIEWQITICPSVKSLLKPLIAAAIALAGLPLLAQNLASQPNSVRDEVLYELFFREIDHFEKLAAQATLPTDKDRFSSYHFKILGLGGAKRALVRETARICMNSLLEFDKSAAEMIAAAKEQRRKGSQAPPSPPELATLQKLRIDAVRLAINTIRVGLDPSEFVYIDFRVKEYVRARVRRNG